MANQNWEKFGEDISRTVQEAIDAQNYERLNQTITNTVNRAMDHLGRGLQDVGNAMDKRTQSFWKQPNRDNRYMDQSVYRNQDSHAKTDKAPLRREPSLFVKTSGAKVGGVVMTVMGYMLGIAMFLVLVFFIIGVFVTTDEIPIGILALSVFTGLMMIGGGVLVGIGTALLGRVKRYRGYLSTLGEKEYCEIKELAGRLKKSNKYVVKDIQKMIQKGWFRQGHLDRQKTCLIVSNDAFAQYNELMQRMEMQRQEAQISKEKKAQEHKALDPRVQEIIRTGDEYIKRIHKSNDAIPGEEISAKISRMEVLVDRIFDRVEQNPDSVTDIRRLMEYYLPTTIKLLEAYEELDTMPVQGENILSSKKEIESTLDTLNVAFENLLDSLFQDTAWDVAADISVLKTMLAQEGLTKDDF